MRGTLNRCYATFFSSFLDIVGEMQIYLVGEFVTYPKKGQGKNKNKRSKSNSGGTKPSPESPAAITSTASASDSRETSQRNETSTLEKEIVRRKLSEANRGTPREDGGVLNCFSVSVYCFKLGRLTVPPVSPRFLCRGVSFVDWFGLSVWESGFGEGSTGRLDLGCLDPRVGVGCPKESSEPDEDSTRWGRMKTERRRPSGDEHADED
jgi:hypothetical protein